jgi:hypothetical protein
METGKRCKEKVKQNASRTQTRRGVGTDADRIVMIAIGDAKQQRAAMAVTLAVLSP